MAKDLTATESAITEVLDNYAEVKLAILFGSLARGTATADSDLDLAVLPEKPLTTEMRIELIADLADRLGRPVDLIDLHRVGEPLLGEVLKGRRILGDDTRYAQLITRHLFDAADFLPYRQRILAERRARWIES